MGIIHLCENAHFTYKILQHTCFNCTCYTCSYDKCVWDMSQYNKLSDIQYTRFQILHVDLHFGLFWSAGIPTMLWLSQPLCNISILKAAWLSQLTPPTVISICIDFIHGVVNICTISKLHSYMDPYQSVPVSFTFIHFNVHVTNSCLVLDRLNVSYLV